jgi:predicted HAD superfamily Cof-like phosphohydrolase
MAVSLERIEQIVGTIPAGACGTCGGEGQIYAETPGGLEDAGCGECHGSGLARSPIREQVIEFHQEFQSEQGQGEGPPHVPLDQHVRLRLRLIFEEAFEALEACLHPAGSLTTDALRITKAKVALLIASPLDVDLPEFIDALGDIDYVVEGSRLACGVNGAPIAAEIHRSNMSKKGGHRRVDGKWVKPSTYSKADIAGELRKQGWKP